MHQFPLYLVLIVIILFLVMFARRINVAYPIVLVVAGLVISFIPSMPEVVINPELIFIIFLPPLLYEAAWETSWKEFWKFRRVISSFAFLIVILTSIVVAWVASSFIPGFTMALGFLLGGIVSPPDAVSASTILKNVKVNRHIKAIIEGESLLNDASSLIVFRFALIAIDTGRFVFYEAAMNFFWVIFAGIAIGIAIGFIFYLVHKLFPTDTNIDIILTIVAPYAMYIGAEAIHVSGVLSVVSGGLFLSARRHLILSNQSRIHGFGVWSAMGFVLNGLVFLLIGLQLPYIVNHLGETSLPEAIGYSVLIAAVLIIGRLISSFGAARFTMFVRRYISVADVRMPDWRNLFVFGWTGMRGVVSLAAALAIPVTLSDGSEFPLRNLVLFITFVVILLTLVVQGLSLPWIIRKLDIKSPPGEGTEEEHDKEIQRRLAANSLQYLQSKCSLEMQSHPYVKQMIKKWEHSNELINDESLQHHYKSAYLDLLEEQRTWLRQWNREFDMEEEIIRKYLMRIDLEEAKIRLT